MPKKEREKPRPRCRKCGEAFEPDGKKAYCPKHRGGQGKPRDPEGARGRERGLDKIARHRAEDVLEGYLAARDEIDAANTASMSLLTGGDFVKAAALAGVVGERVVDVVELARRNYAALASGDRAAIAARVQACVAVCATMSAFYTAAGLISPSNIGSHMMRMTISANNYLPEKPHGFAQINVFFRGPKGQEVKP